MSFKSKIILKMRTIVKKIAKILFILLFTVFVIMTNMCTGTCSEALNDLIKINLKR